MQLWVDLLAPVIQDMIFIATSGQWSEDNAVIRNYKVLLGAKTTKRRGKGASTMKVNFHGESESWRSLLM